MAKDDEDIVLDLSQEWIELGARLGTAGPEKFRDTLARLREVVEAQEIIARHDRQLFFRGRPRKRYLA